MGSEGHAMKSWNGRLVPPKGNGGSRPVREAQRSDCRGNRFFRNQLQADKRRRSPRRPVGDTMKRLYKLLLGALCLCALLWTRTEAAAQLADADTGAQGRSAQSFVQAPYW